MGQPENFFEKPPHRLLESGFATTASIHASYDQSRDYAEQDGREPWTR
jgi:hypothetical protein